MSGDERRQVILELVRTNGADGLKKFARTAAVPEMTVRRDPRPLDSEGLLGRRHRGAAATGGPNHERTYFAEIGVVVVHYSRATHKPAEPATAIRHEGPNGIITHTRGVANASA